VPAAKTRRPTTTPKPQDNAVRALVRAFGLLQRVNRPHFARYGISAPQWSVLRALQQAEREGQRWLRVTDLSELLLIQPPSVTGVLDRLERAGLVSRAGSVDDLRVKHVCLTLRAHRLLGRVCETQGRHAQAILRGLAPVEREELQRLLGRLSKHLQVMLGRNGRPRASQPVGVKVEPGSRGLP
jgi:DNA-binding MarR family transcriptional regulator